MSEFRLVCWSCLLQASKHSIVTVTEMHYILWCVALIAVTVHYLWVRTGIVVAVPDVLPSADADFEHAVHELEGVVS